MVSMREMPHYLPGFVDISEFQKDLDAIDLLTGLRRQLGRSKESVDDTGVGLRAPGAGSAPRPAIADAASRLPLPKVGRTRPLLTSHASLYRGLPLRYPRRP